MGRHEDGFPKYWGAWRPVPGEWLAGGRWISGNSTIKHSDGCGH
jgi:hypothetical protein